MKRSTRIQVKDKIDRTWGLAWTTNWLAGSLRWRDITSGEVGLEGRQFNFGSVKF